ncbi:hypothetical protein FSARC_9214 [Fusarium sarcochroum]|uniref:Extracellular protein n=1 Tax=Fusarium sarcochroum TaxID=1208366 RepID=A0A8H4TR77_9HYPO|nr:hypothetical protein FSARC_9214 [Fusarium sarcochroum]
MRPTTIFQLPATIAVVFLLFSCLVLASPNLDNTHRTLNQRDEEVGSGCSTEGQWHCMTNSFQRCANGQWSVKMAMAEGTKCVPAGYTDDYNFRIEHDGQENGENNDGNGDGASQSNGGSSVGSRGSVSVTTVVAMSWLWVVLGFLV